MAAIRAAAADWAPRLVLVEDSAAGQSAVQELRRLSDLPVVAVPPRGSKVSRAEAVQSLFESGRVLFPANAGSWRDELVEELAGFPAGRHDDQVDALVYAIACLRASSSPGRAPTVGGREESSLLADLGSPTWRGTGRLDEGISSDMSF